MILVSYTPQDELDISGSASDLQAVRAQLLALAQGSNTQFVVEADKEATPKPYLRSLSAIKGRVTVGPIRVSVIDDSVEVEGSKDSFLGFASFFDFDKNSLQGEHTHHEYYEGNQFVHPLSVPLVVSIR
ncbi:MAG TPA: hypothetical protein VK138_01720 [Acidiferrobacterales bacterium]|nr:hypothetical protein [Acidiferrobacterales bacterium]